jgi:hypothetical protein
LIWALGFFGIFLYGLCFFFGLQHPGRRGALVVALNPAVIVMTAWLIGKERMTTRKAIGQPDRPRRLPDGDRQRRPAGAVPGHSSGSANG